jgi:hypothetical protein
MRSKRCVLAVLPLLWIAAPARSAPGAFTDRAAFQTAVPGGVATLDLESFSNGTSLSGTTQAPAGAAAGIVFPGPIADVLDPGGPPLDLRVVVDAVDDPAGSGTRVLGVDDAGNFHAITAGSAMMFGFTSSVEAFGLTLITLDLLLADGTPTTRAFDSGTGKQTGWEAWNF